MSSSEHVFVVQLLFSYVVDVNAIRTCMDKVVAPWSPSLEATRLLAEELGPLAADCINSGLETGQRPWQMCLDAISWLPKTR